MLNLTHTQTHTNLSKDLFVDGEGEVQDVSDGVVLHPLQGLMELFIQVLQVREICSSEGQIYKRSEVREICSPEDQIYKRSEICSSDDQINKRSEVKKV